MYSNWTQIFIKKYELNNMLKILFSYLIENLGSVLEDKDKIINQLKQDIDQLKVILFF